MRVDEVAQRGQFAEAPRQELAEGHHHAEIRPARAQRLQHLRIRDRFRAVQRQAERRSALRDRARLGRAAPTARAVRLAHDRDHVVRAAHQPLEGRQREVRRAEEDDAQER